MGRYLLREAEPKLENIEADNKVYGQEEMGYKMLLKWKRELGKEAINKTLRDALTDAGRKDLSDNLLRR